MLPPPSEPVPDPSPTRWVLRVRVKSTRDFWPERTVGVSIDVVSGGVGHETKWVTMTATTSPEAVFEGRGSLQWGATASVTDWDQPRAARIHVAPGDDKTLEVEITPKHWVSFALVDPTGAPVDGASIRSSLPSGRSTTQTPGTRPAVLTGVRDDTRADVPEVSHDAVWEVVEVTST